MSDNLFLYNRVRAVPDNAKKQIKGGRLKGMTDISPMWRIKRLTEEFGPCGFGWKYDMCGQWTENGAEGVVMAFCNINLYIKKDGEWSEAIPGTGGAMLVAKESGGLYSSDEAFKMALTDALSVACKAIGMGADVYWDKDSKYDEPPVTDAPPVPPAPPAPPVCRGCGEFVKPVKTVDKSYTAIEFAENTGGLCLECYKQAKAEASQAGDSQ